MTAPPDSSRSMTSRRVASAWSSRPQIVLPWGVSSRTGASRRGGLGLRWIVGRRGAFFGGRDVARVGERCGGVSVAAGADASPSRAQRLGAGGLCGRGRSASARGGSPPLARSLPWRVRSGPIAWPAQIVLRVVHPVARLGCDPGGGSSRPVVQLGRQEGARVPAHRYGRSAPAASAVPSTPDRLSPSMSTVGSPAFHSATSANGWPAAR